MPSTCAIIDCDKNATVTNFDITLLQLRSNLDVKTMQVDDFIDLLFDLMSNLRPHHFIAKDQTKYFIESRENLQPSEVIVSGDFSENYNFIVQIAHSLSTGTMVAVQFTLGRFIIGLKEMREYSTSHMQ